MRRYLLFLSIVSGGYAVGFAAPARYHIESTETIANSNNIYVKVFSVTGILQLILLSVIALGIIALIIFLFVKIRHMRKSINVMGHRWRFVSHEMGLSISDWNLKEGRIYYSPEWKKNLGYSESEIGDSVDEWRGRIHPDDIGSSIHRRTIDATISDHLRGEYRLRMRDGTYKWVQSRGRVIERDDQGNPLRIVGFYFDVTKTKETERALEESRSLIIAQLENSNDMIFVIDRNNRIDGRSKLATAPSLDKIYSSMPAAHRKKHRALIRRCFETGEKHEFDFVISESCVLSVRYVPLKKGKDVSRVMIIINDISAKRRMEEKEKIMRDQIAHADRIMSLGLLVSGVAHEINNPNQCVLTNLSFFEDVWKSVIPILDDYSSENGDFLLGGLPYSAARNELLSRHGMVCSGARKISTIVDELKSFARKDSADTLVDVSVNDAVRSAVEILMGQIRKATTDFSVEYGDVPFIRANKNRIEQVAVNLIQNACQSLSDTNKKIRAKTGCKGNGTVFFSVTDEGCGMSAEVLNNIQIPFYTTKRDKGGTGLGLYVSRNIIQSYGGVIEYSSEEGRGTTVTVLIPSADHESNSDIHKRV
jgi:PAS domain S-box-containing protein